MFFKNSDSCFYIKCVTDSNNDDSGQCSTSAANSIKPNSNSNKRKKSKSECNVSKIKVVRCNEESLDNIDAALSSAEKLLEINTSNYTVSAKKRKILPVKPETLISEVDVNKNIDNETSTVKNISPKDISIVVEKNFTNSTKANEDSNNLLHSTFLKTNKISYSSTIKLNKECEPSTSNNTSKLESNTSKDTVFITIPSISDKWVDVSFSRMMSNDNIRNFILEGGMIKSDDENVEAYNPTEIDQIVSDEIIFGVRYYLVKWKTWSVGFTTWERFGALSKAQKLIYDYAFKKEKNIDHLKPINGIHLLLSRTIITKLFDLFRSQNGLALPLILPDDLSSLFNSLDVGRKKAQLSRMISFQWYLRTIALSNYRRQQLFKLKLWEFDINLMTMDYKIKVENNVDLEGPPNVFVYTSKYIPSTNIVIPNDPPIGCSCKKNCANSNGCCSEMSGYSVVYDANKMVVKAPGYPIYECNKKCKCTSDCHNRVVQHGSKVNVCIYKTTSYGWGVKTNMNIKKGQFVAKYIGEIITVEESEKRLENNTSCLDYMWNLDFNDPQNYKYIIDGTHYNNFTYFLNHSCNANLNVYAVWINCLDPNLPELALFASRDIFAGEQLTTNYFTRTNVATLKKSGIRCRCNTKNCKGYYF